MRGEGGRVYDKSISRNSAYSISPIDRGEEITNNAPGCSFQTGVLSQLHIKQIEKSTGRVEGI